jgi:hypothetical protein
MPTKKRNNNLSAQAGLQRLSPKEWNALTPKQQQDTIDRRNRKLKRTGKLNKKIGVQPGAGTGKNRFGNKYGKHNVQIIPISPSPTQKKVLNVNANIAPGTVNLAFLTLSAFLGTKNVFGDPETTGLGNPGPLIYAGLAWAMQGVNTAAVGATQELIEAPRVVHDLLNALKPKEVNFHRDFKVSYGWNQYDPTVPLLPINVGDGVFALTYPDYTPGLDLGQYDFKLIFAPSYAGNPDLYSSFTKVTGGLTECKGLEIVAIDAKSRLGNDVSSYARSYRYVGLAPTAGNGVYKDIENEVPITAPMYSGFCEYQIPDVRVPRKLTPFAGGPNMSMGWPLHNSFVSHFNKVNPVYKQIDFEEIYCYLCALMVRAKEIAQTSPVDQKFAQPLPFSQQSFRVMLRQALLSVFQDSQFMTQFEGYTQYDATTNAFVPLLVTGGTAARTVFQEMIVPSIFSENINALRARSIRLGDKTSQINVASFLPIVGRYYEDTPAEFLYSLGGAMTPLFTTVPGQAAINLTDMAALTLGANYYVDPNCSHYQGVMNDWNMTMTGLAAVMSQTRPIIIDGGAPGLGLLYVTRVQERADTEGAAKKPARRPTRGYYQEMALVNLANSEERVLDRSDSKKSLTPTVIPAADIRELCSRTLTSQIPLSSEEEVFFTNIITPVVRLNPTEDALTLPMYQTITSEAGSSPLSTSISGFGIGVYGKLFNYAGWSVTGVGKDQTNDYIEMMKILQQRGRAGFLSGLLGSVVKAIVPGSGPIVDTVTSFLP